MLSSLGFLPFLLFQEMCPRHTDLFSQRLATYYYYYYTPYIHSLWLSSEWVDWLQI
jgi:hypothetical protein